MLVILTFPLPSELQGIHTGMVSHYVIPWDQILCTIKIRSSIWHVLCRSGCRWVNQLDT